MDVRRTGDAAVTGVAGGSLGTGTALDETQEWVVPEGLQPNAPADPPVPVAAAAAPVAQVEPVGPVEPRPVARRPRTSSAPARPRGGFSPGPRTAGIAAVLLLGLVGLTAVVTSLDGNQAGSAPQAPTQATAAPTDAPAEEAGGNGGPKDKDKGNGKGRGNGGGRGND